MALCENCANEFLENTCGSEVQGNYGSVANCATITDSGWYECSSPLIGASVALMKIGSSANYPYGVWSFRAYTGLNVIPLATLSFLIKFANLIKFSPHVNQLEILSIAKSD